MTLSLGFSPCPNDCFIFDALVHHKIDTEGLRFDTRLEDVETLNRMALQGELEITKLSFHAYAHCLKQYILLRAGSALGFNCGPLLVKKKGTHLKNESNMRVAIPGKLTTANFLLSLAYPNLKEKVEYVFSDIEEAVIKGEVDAGLIIHENRFTYADKGLEKIRDLGEYWDEQIHAPIPLGGIVIKRELETALQQKVNRVINRSLAYAFANPESSMNYVREHAQSMSEEVMKQHIALYVNAFSLDLGVTGIAAIDLMFNKAEQNGLFRTSGMALVIEAE